MYLHDFSRCKVSYFNSQNYVSMTYFAYFCKISRHIKHPGMIFVSNEMD